MKRFMQFLVVAALVVSAASVSFAGFVSSAPVAMSATVNSISSMGVEVRNVTDDVIAAYALGTLDSGGTYYDTAGKQYVEITIADNSVWKIKTYTDNFTVAPSTPGPWGYQYGGLSNYTSSTTLSLAWQASTATVLGGISVGSPAISTTTGWTFIKDHHDAWDPGSLTDNSFATADAEGYTTVAYGSVSYANITVPNVLPEQYRAIAVGAPFYLYTEVDRSVVAAGSYTGTLVIDLSHN
ncbi:MAG: hypothetical protein M0Q46_05510 [Endomicrobiales bacterium]|nr:hypothetical protein [Endomicrobiales bacterium]